ncbi:MAG: opioid growth factor receptor-related protein [Gammaproteobacteria bacterium]
MTRITNFYSGMEGDDQGRMLADILQHDDTWLERTHDYIQWLFPNREASTVTPWAPLITSEDVEEFSSKASLRNELRVSFRRILSFYGMEVSEGRIVKAANWDERKHNWFTQDTHNNMRITRILKCLMALSLEREARHFYKVLKNLVENDTGCGITPPSIRYWSEAVGE